MSLGGIEFMGFALQKDSTDSTGKAKGLLNNKLYILKRREGYLTLAVR